MKVARTEEWLWQLDSSVLSCGSLPDWDPGRRGTSGDDQNG